MGQLCKIPFLAWINSAEIVLWTWKIHICTHTQDQRSSLCNLFLSPTFGGFQLHLAIHMLYEHTNILTSSLDNLKKSKKYPHLFKLLGKQISKKKSPQQWNTKPASTCQVLEDIHVFPSQSLTDEAHYFSFSIWDKQRLVGDKIIQKYVQCLPGKHRHILDSKRV